MRQPRVFLSALALTSFMLGGTAFAQTPATVPDTAKPTANPAPVAAAAVSAPAPGIVISGLLEANYTYNFNNPTGNKNGFAYNDLAQQFALNLAEVQVKKNVTPASRAGFTVKLIEGEVKKLTTGATEDGGTSNVLEAYGTMLIPFGTRDLTVDAGQFETHVGYETIEIGTNNFFSKSFLFSIPEPAYNAGLRASYPVSAKLTANGYIYNRFNGRTNAGNHDLAPGFQLAYTLNPASSFIFNGLTAHENIGTAAASNNKQQNILNVIYQNQLNATRKVVLEGVYRFGKNTDNDKYNVFGVAGYLVFGTVGLRAEYLAEGDHHSDFLIPSGTTKKVTLGSVTASLEPKTGLFPGLRTLLEVRYDYANEKVFVPKDAAADGKKNQLTLTVGQIYSF